MSESTAGELRQIAAEYDALGEKWQGMGDSVRASVYRVEASALWKRANELDPK
jgi:hypothetical protein